MNEPVPYSPPSKKRGWLKILGVTAVVLIVLLVATYFTVTSAAFLKAVVLPRAGKTLGVTLTLNDASLSPFSQITLKGLKIQASGGEPLLQVSELRARYDLREIIKGHILVEEIVISSPVVNVSQSADGKSNFDPILTATKSSGPKKETTSKPSAPPQLDIKLVKLENATVHFTQQLKTGARQFELNGVNLSVADVKNGQAAKTDSPPRSPRTGRRRS
ncbi:MAG: AsmA family protein [Verrucomicrobia bacterium]|nr:AsmA family protein [Verrucomicrobiota bacterium]